LTPFDDDDDGASEIALDVWRSLESRRDEEWNAGMEWGNGPTPTENRHSKLQRTDAVPTTNYQISPAKSVCSTTVHISRWDRLYHYLACSRAVQCKTQSNTTRAASIARPSWVPTRHDLPHARDLCSPGRRHICSQSVGHHHIIRVRV